MNTHTFTADYVELKRCSKCGHDKPTTEYSKNKNTRDGLQHQCKKCWRAYCKLKMRRYHERLQAETPIVYGVRSKRLGQWVYVGWSTFQLEKRRAFHLNQARSNPRCKVHEAINLLGEDDLEWVLLERTDDPSREAYWVEALRTHEHGFNMTRTGKGGRPLCS